MTLARRASAVALASSALWLAGCGSTVKLDDPKPAPITTSANAPTPTPAASTVAPVEATQVDPSALPADLARVIYFDFDSYVVREDARGTVEGYAKYLNANKSKHITIEGHTDARGGSEYNLALGQKRAEATAKALGLLGVSANQLEAVSFGKERPAVEGSGEEAWAKNRRAEFKGR
ncbi:MAG TPA: peptidoglycan-associated lipoprotein Pal [Candidatus Aquabacterium excrementipullorum]|nr:peptidoglycan-associated lipoprotein Pal [Candidatus Aquabacterium excrementipullorum]